ncbi:ABC transporter permease [Kribbella sp. CA-294648]|uniref:ABC transporter permease n=1 Tax=Kribbella sp. CA-294648 TaxID=3239948 RepID=UPI003D94CD0E
MSTPLRTTYPAPVEELIPAARKLADKLGRIPSQNKIKTELRIGTEKARMVRAALMGFDSQPTPDPAPEPVEPHLRVVEDQTPDAPTEPDNGPDGEPAGSGEEMPPAPQAGASPQVTPHTEPDKTTAPTAAPVPAEAGKPVRTWPVWVLALPAFVAVWSGWVGLGGLTGFGVVAPLPGIADGFTINTAITLPIGVETYAAFALRVWLSGTVPSRARKFAMWSALGSLLTGALGQVAYHLLEAAGYTKAPWPIVMAVACLPVAVLGMGAALAHLIHARPTTEED